MNGPLYISLRAGVADRVAGKASISTRSIADGLLLDYPVSCRNLITLLIPIDLKFTFNPDIVTGSCELMLASSGSVRYQGQVHDSGALAEKYTVWTSIGAGPLFLVGHEGTLAGTFAFGSRDDSWDESVTDAWVQHNWTLLKNYVGAAYTNYGTGSDLFEVVEAAASGATGTYVLNL